MLEVETTQLRWTPEFVRFNGKLYKAPLDLLSYFVSNVLIEMLIERKKNNERNKI